MSKSISPGDLQKAISDYLETYKEDINEEVKETANQMAQGAKEELARISPVSDTDVILKGGEVHKAGDYAKGWTVSTQSQKNAYSKKVWNKTNYQLTHLLEFGHASRSGGRVNPSPRGGHIRKTEDKYLQKFEKELEKKIRSTK